MKPFRHVEMHRPRRSVFDLSHYKLFDCDLGQLVPVLAKKMVPGDHFKISNEIVVRAQPLVAPLMHEINLYVHYFFVPLRLLWPKPVIEGSMYPPDEGSWEEFFTGGVDGLLEPKKPKLYVSNYAHTAGLYNLWDYFGFPVGMPWPNNMELKPDAWYFRAYNFVYNEYYRDQTYMDEVDFDHGDLKYRCWEKDYFTSALPWEQRGQAPALPITGITNAEFLGLVGDTNRIAPVGLSYDGIIANPQYNQLSGSINESGQPAILGGSGTNPSLNWSAYNTDISSNFKAWLENNRVDLSNASTFDVNDLRLAFQTQKFLERNARAGARYIEQLRAHYGVSPRDDRLQRPEYIGGSKSPVIISEVLQTSSTDSTSPQGNLAGHGMVVDRQYCASYYAQEFGIVIGIMSLMPRPVYQQGFPRELLGDTRYDELLPEFVSLGEQPIYGAELYLSLNDSENTKVFGFNGRFDEYRTAQNMVCGTLRNNIQDSLGFWHLARSFQSSPGLNKEFLECRPRKDYLAVPSKPGWIVTFGNIIRAVRPLPVVGTPGLIDHH